MKKLALAAALGLSLFGTAALAADPPAVTRNRGTIERIDGDTLQIKTRSGQQLTLHLTATTRVASVSRAKIEDIASDSYVGSAAVPTPDGNLRALEVAVFAASMRGNGDGHYPWDLGNNSTMTNGAVGSVTGTSDRTLIVRYNGGERRIVVPTDVPIVSLAPSDRTVIKAGAHVVAVVPNGAEPAGSVATLLVGLDGVVPPM